MKVEKVPVDHEVRTVLASIVERFGFERVSRALHEMASSQTRSRADEAVQPHRRGRSKGSGNRHHRSAVEYVRTMDMAAERAEVVGRAAREFERRTFLPTLGDIRSFCEVYGIEEPSSKSRVSGIPRIFKFLATMDTSDVEKILNDRMFSGPVELGPIADAIRGKSREMRRPEQPADKFDSDSTSYSRG